MRATTAFLALAVLATVAAAALALPAAGLAEAAEAAAEVLGKERLTEDDVNALPKVEHSSEDAEVEQSKDTVKALPMAVPSQDAVDAKPKAVPSKDAVDAEPKAVSSKDAVDAKPKAGLSEVTDNALRMEGHTEDNVNALPKIGNSEDTVDAKPKAVPSNDAVDAKPKAVPSKDAVDAKPKDGLAEVTDNALLAEDAVMALPADKVAANVSHPEDADNAQAVHSPSVEAVAVACPRDDPSKFLNACIKRNLQALAPLMNEGGKRVGLPSLEPYFVPEVKLDFKSLLMELHGDMTNVSVKGFTNLTVEDVRAALKDDAMDLEVDVKLPLMEFTGDFNATTGLFWNMYQFNGTGPFGIFLRNITATWSFQGKREPGSKHMTIVKASPEYSVDGMLIGFKNFLEGHPILDIVAMFMANLLQSEVLSFGKPTVQGDISEHLRMLSNAVFQHLPYDTIFPPTYSPPLVVDVIYRSGIPV